MTSINSTTYDEIHSNGIAYSLHVPKSETNLPLLILCHPFNNSRTYWNPQVNDPLLELYPKLVLDSLGFAQSSTSGCSWTFDDYTHKIFEILDKLDAEVEGERRLRSGFECVLIGDSMGGGPTGLRVALLDAKRVREEGKRKLIKGVVAIGTSSEEESKDFVEEYSEAASVFAQQCQDPSIGPLLAIKDLATNMANDGYTPSNLEPFLSARQFGQSVIEESLKITLTSGKGIELDSKFAGEAMITNFRCLNYREGLVEKLSVRPSPLICQILVIHGSLDKAYPLERNYHQITFNAVGEDNAELYIVEGGPHFVTVTHVEEVDRKIVEWIGRKC